MSWSPKETPNERPAPEVLLRHLITPSSLMLLSAGSTLSAPSVARDLSSTGLSLVELAESFRDDAKNEHLRPMCPDDLRFRGDILLSLEYFRDDPPELRDVPMDDAAGKSDAINAWCPRCDES
eukprot:3279740-Prymnesium_polylepis.2